MKTFVYIIISFFLLKNGLAQKTVLGPHGGKVQEASFNYKVELLLSPGDFYTFLLDENSKPVSNKGITCTINLCYNNCDKLEHLLIPFSGDGFSAENIITKDFFSCKITFHLPGKVISSEFYNDTDASGKE